MGVGTAADIYQKSDLDNLDEMTEPGESVFSAGIFYVYRYPGDPTNDDITYEYGNAGSAKNPLRILFNSDLDDAKLIKYFNDHNAVHNSKKYDDEEIFTYEGKFPVTIAIDGVTKID
ncbi:hypothetical protein GGF41_001452 [Coemansia sp. RSA 2531]|nr:hypothetical protein GGF41_001452 [Coemansia sp. RSA 2531]